MRYTALLLLVVLGFASCNMSSFLAREFRNFKDGSDTSSSSSDASDIDAFFGGLFNSFGLDKPKDIIDCFSGKKDRIAFFGSLYEKYELLKDSTERSSILVHIDYAKLKLIYKVLESAYSCAFISNDMTDLLSALNISGRDPKKWGMALYINYQAHYDDLYSAYKPMIGFLDTQNFTEAGYSYGSILNYTIKTIRAEGSHLQSFNGFGNGFSVSLDIDEPSDSLQCYDNDTSIYWLEFLYKLSVAVTDGKLYEAPVNTLNFWENEGKQIISQIPQDVMDCDAQSNDHQAVIQKLGIDIYTEQFGDLLKRYVNNHRLVYYGYMKGLRSAFEDHNFVHAGKYYGDFISAVAAKNKE